MTNQLTPEQISKLRDLALRVNPQKPWNNDLVAKAAYECALDLTQLLDVYEEVTRKHFDFIMQVKDSLADAQDTIDATRGELSEAQQLLQAVVEVLRGFGTPMTKWHATWWNRQARPLLDKLNAHLKETEK